MLGGANSTAMKQWNMPNGAGGVSKWQGEDVLLDTNALVEAQIPTIKTEL